MSDVSATRKDRFEGRIFGLGTSSGARFVVGDWRRSPFGRFTDVFVAHPDGRRELLAPSERIAEYVCATYQFDDVTVGSVTAEDSADLHLEAGALRIDATVGPRLWIGQLLRPIPRRLAATRAFAHLADPFARRLLPGVRTIGSAGNGRVEWYGAYDLRTITTASVTWHGADLGALADVDPDPAFGFGSTPRRPMVTYLTTTVRLPHSHETTRPAGRSSVVGNAE